MDDNTIRKNKAAISIGKGTLAIILINTVLFIALNNNLRILAKRQRREEGCLTYY